jgi:hypothetical protein
MASIVLSEVDFHKLMSKLRHVEVLRLEAERKAAQIVQQEIASVATEGRQLFEALATEYGFDPAKRWRFDEATLSLTEEP